METKTLNTLKGKKEIINQLATKHKISTITSKLDEIKEEKIKVKVAFLGEFSSGKTSLINALMKTKFLPMFDKPTTAVITEIKKGEENKFEIVKEGLDGEEIKNVSPSELVSEIQKIEANKKIIIYLKDTEILDDNTILIDTPGVSSINDSHSDVTYGYLPTADVAFVVVNINMGSMSKTLNEFIGQYPEEIKSKIYFVLTHIDTKSEKQIENLKKEFSTSLKDVVVDPRIILVSSKEAIAANDLEDDESYVKSGVQEVADIIKTEIPKYKEEVQKRRTLGQVQELASEFLIGLDTMLNSVEFDDTEIYNKINQLRLEQDKIERDKRLFTDEITKIEKKVRLEAEGSASIATAGVIEGMLNRTDYSDDLLTMVAEIQNSLTVSLTSIESLEVPSLNKGFASTMVSQIEQEFRSVFNIADKLSSVANMALVAYIGPAGGAANLLEAGAAGAAGVIVNKTLEGRNNEKIIPENLNSKKTKDKQVPSRGDKFKSFLGALMDKLDVVGFATDIAMRETMKGKVERKLKQIARNQVSIIFNQLKITIDQIIKEKYLQPLLVNNEVIINLKDNRKKEEKSSTDLRVEISEDIKLLKTI